MRTTFKITFVLALFCTSAFGQGARYDGISLNGSGGILTGASVYVCADPASGSPCTSLASLYSNISLTQSLSNPLTSDAFGKFYFYALPGNYMIQVYNGSSLLYTLDNVSVTPSAVADKGGQVFNVKAYGARGDGSTNDTAAINSTISLGCGSHGIIYFPPGSYKIVSPLNVTNMTNCTLAGANPGSSNQGFGAAASTIVWNGSATTNAAVDFSHSYGMFVHDLGVTYSSSSAQPGAAMLFDGSGFGDNRLTNVSLSAGSVADLVSCGSESLSVDGQSFLGVAPQYGTPRGVLLSSNGCSGYNITSAFGFTFAPSSETMFRFVNVDFQYNGGDNAVDAELDGTGSGIPIDNVYLQSCYMPAGGSSTSVEKQVYIKGAVTNLTLTNPRYEIDSTTGAYHFLDLASGASLRDFSVTSYDTSNEGGTFSYAFLSSDGSATLQTGHVYGTSVTLNFTGNVNDVSVHDINPLSVTVNGSVSGGTWYGENGSPSWSVSGSYNVDLQGLKNVVFISGVYSGSSTYNLPGGSSGYTTGIYKASYIAAACQFAYADGLQQGSGNYVVVSNVTSAAAANVQSLACPAPGSYSSGQSITATFTNTGGYFIVQAF
jgi:hypothetical protein